MLKTITRQLIFTLVGALFVPAAQGQAAPTAAPIDATSSTPVANADTIPVEARPSTEISSRSAIVVQEFSVNDKTGWPYDPKQLQSQGVAELRAKCGDRIDILVGPPATSRIHTYTLNGEIVSWHPGNRTKRMIVGMGSGRETAEIRYWLEDETGKKLFDHKDTIRAEFWGNAYAGSVGELAHPFASKIAGRLAEAKLF
jgi:hypothetical protein